MCILTNNYNNTMPNFSTNPYFESAEYLASPAYKKTMYAASWINDYMVKNSASNWNAQVEFNKVSENETGDYYSYGDATLLPLAVKTGPAARQSFGGINIYMVVAAAAVYFLVLKK